MARWLDRLRPFDALVLTSAIWFLAKFVRYAFPPLFETFQRQYGVSPSTLGLLFTLLMLVYAAMQFPSGALADRFGTVRVIAGGAVVLAVAALGLAATQAFAALVVAMAGIGLGTGVHKTAAISLLGRAYPARTGRTLGTMDAIGSLGGVAAPAAVVALLATPAGWPGLFLAIAVAAGVLAAGFVRVAPRRLRTVPGSAAAGSPAPAGAAGLAGYLSVVRAPRVAGFVVVVVTYTFAFNGMVAFLPLFLVSAKGLGTAEAGLFYAVLFAVSLVQPVTGGLADRVGRYPLMVGTLALAGGSLAGVVVGAPPLVLGALVALVGLGGHGFRPVRDAHLVGVLPAEAAGGSLGIVRTVMMGVGAVSPAVVGIIAEGLGFGVAFGLLETSFGLGAVLVAGIGVATRRRPNPSPRAR